MGTFLLASTEGVLTADFFPLFYGSLFIFPKAKYVPQPQVI